MKNKTRSSSEVNVARSVSRAKSKIKSQKSKLGKKATIRVRRVNEARPNMASSIASQLGYDNLAQDLTSQPKAVVPDFVKTKSGNTIDQTIRKLKKVIGFDYGHNDLAGGLEGPYQYELPESVADAFQNTYGATSSENDGNATAGATSSENDGNATAGLAAWLITRSALQRVQQFENLVADATKEYWQAKRKLLLVNKILASAYKSLETEDVENIKLPSKEEIHSVITDTLANELFPSDSNGRGRSANSIGPINDAAKRQMFKRCY
jgi:hypothetical protein